MTEPDASLLLGPDRSGRTALWEAGRLVHWGLGEPAAPAGTLRLPCPQADLRPAWVNAHTHLYSGLAPLGMPPPAQRPRNFLEILDRIWWRLDRALDAAALRAAARLAAAEAILAGTGTLVDHHESPQLIEGSLELLADVCQELGIRAVLCYGATERNGGPDEARRGLEECRRFLLSNRRPLVRGLIGLHASFTVSDETIHAAGRLCVDQGVPLHVHVAEDACDVFNAQERGYAGPLERLEKLGALPPGSILAHGVHLTRSQVLHAQDLGAWFVQNPRSNRGNGVGYPLALRCARRVALGTDGYPADMPEEMRALSEEAAEHGEEASVAEVRARAGSDLAAERFGHGVAADLGAFGTSGPVHLVVGGRLVLREGRLTGGDLDAIRAEARQEAERLWKRMARI
jgi:cytosine/adenosine deaminase-related metal-dependent hydrolase